MNRLLPAVLGLLALSAAAAAASDFPERYMPRAPSYVPFFSWNGFYLGINGGYSFGHSNWTDTTTQASIGDFKIKGGLVGGTAGYNIQLGGIVVGLEGDLDWSNIKGSATATCGDCQTSNNWLGTARGRIGYAFDRFLPYLTGGAAFGDIKGKFGSVGSFKDTSYGWSAGVGLEYAFIRNWSAKVEYLHADLGTARCGTDCSGGTPFDVAFKTNIVRAGLNYKF